MPASGLRAVLGGVLLYSAAAPFLWAQQPAPQPAGEKSDMSAMWDQLISTAIPQAPPDPTLTVPQTPVTTSDFGDFLQHFYFQSRSDYERYQTSFTGNPTTAGVIDAPFTGTFNPAGIPSLSAFQPGANRVEEFLDFGTTGYGSDRINTHVAMRYVQDTSHVDIGSPAENVIETLNANRLYEILDANVQISGKPTDGFFAGTTTQIGRLNVYGAELASFDGASFDIDRQKFNFEIYGGRRFEYFADPAQRGIGGANLTLKLDPDTSVELETLWYIRGSHRIIFRKRFNERWLLTSYLRAFGGSPVDFNASILYSSRSGKTTLNAGFFQKLTDNDYTYDYTSLERDLAARNSLYALYLGPLNRYTQVNFAGHRQIFSNLRASAEIVVRELNNNNDQTPFETSFRDYRFNGQYFPWRKIELSFEYHQRSSDRLSPLLATTLDPLESTGETAVKDLTGTIGRTFGEGRFSVQGGVYYRRISMQDPFYYEEKLHQSGVLGSAWVRLDRRTRAYFDYTLDNDFFLFTPDLKNSQMFRLGVNWKY